MRIERQPGEIDVLAGDLNGVNGSVSGRDFHHRLRIGQALEILVVDFFFSGFERGDQALSAGRGLRHHFRFFRAHAFEQHRLLALLDDRAKPRQRHRLVVDFDLIHVDQPLDKPTEPILFHVDIGRGFGTRHHRIPSAPIRLRISYPDIALSP